MTPVATPRGPRYNSVVTPFIVREDPVVTPVTISRGPRRTHVVTPVATLRGSRTGKSEE